MRSQAVSSSHFVGGANEKRGREEGGGGDGQMGLMAIVASDSMKNRTIIRSHCTTPLALKATVDGSRRNRKKKTNSRR